MAGLDDYKPAMAMVGLQISYAIVALFSRAILLQGMSPRVFLVYKEAVATLVLTPMSYLSRRRKSSTYSLNLRSFSLIFLAALIGVTINQNLYFEGLYLASSSITTAMMNLVPAVTFVMASITGLEWVNFGSVRSIAKILGTILCVGGAVFMALVRGPKVLNAEFLLTKSLFGSGGENWMPGCLLLFGCCFCWPIWLILQVPASASYPDQLSLSAWMCFMATIQAATFSLFVEREPQAWNIHSSSIGVIIGLYAVLWGKAKDLVEMNESKKIQTDEAGNNVNILKVDSSEKSSCIIDLEEPLLANKASDVENGICH
ncbi:WAT1-related protein At4g30420-like [Fagus crenata]